ncbi:MAG: tetratricopeptide repeat protein [Myxococcota bacterium]|nr:tetratricopeptide repeat protein [Myxococcota bacterium]
MRAIVAIGALLVLICTACEFDRATVDSDSLERIAKLKNDAITQPTSVQAHYSLALSLEEAGLDMEAADTYHQVLQLNDTHGPSLGALGRLYEKLGYFTASYRQLMTCVRVAPDQPECLYQLGALLQRDGSNAGLQQSLTYWRRFLETAQNHPKRAEVQRRLNEVEAQLDTALDKTPPSNEVAAAAPTGAPQAASALPNHSSEKSDDSVGELNPFGKAIGEAIAAIRKKDSPTAEKAFRRALALRPNDAGAMAGLAETLFHQKKTSEAQSTISKAYEIDPKNAQTQWVFGLIMIKTGQNIGKALEAWEALNRESPEFAKQVGVTKTLETVKQMREGKQPQ